MPEVWVLVFRVWGLGRGGQGVWFVLCDGFHVHAILVATSLAQYTIHSIHYTVYSIQYTVCSTQHTVHSIQYTVCSTQYTVYSPQ
jgi:hypothetical protein